MPPRTAIGLTICLCLGGLVVGAGGSFLTAADEGEGDVPGLSEPESDLEIDSAITDTEGETTVIVQLADRPNGAVVATATENQVASMQSHANTTQTTFERFADGNPHVEIERQFWITNALVVTVDTDRVPLERLGMVENVTAIRENAAVEVASVGRTASAGTAEPPTAAMTPIPQLTTNDSFKAANVETTYGLEQINAPKVWETFDTRGEGAKVAVLDTGYDTSYDDDIGLYTRDETDPTYPGGWAEFDYDGFRVIEFNTAVSNYDGTQIVSFEMMGVME